MAKVAKKRFSIIKWIFFSVALVANSFIVFYSCLDSKTTEKMAEPFARFFVNLVNSITTKENENVPLESITVILSSDKYNDIPGYNKKEIPLGSAKEFICEYYPSNTTDKSVSFYAEPSDSLVLNQSSSKVSVIGMKTGKASVCAKSGDGKLVSKAEVMVVETVAPVNFEVSLKENNEIQIGKPKTLLFDIDGGVLTHDELINFRYYDIRKLIYSSSDEAIATVDENGVIYPHSVGVTTIAVSNGFINKAINIVVTDGLIPSDYATLSITGDSICYANDMILNQTNPKYKHQLSIRDGENILEAEDFLWTSSNELLVKVDSHGVVRGFRKSSLGDETAVITATSKITGQKCDYLVTVKNQLPTTMDWSFKVGSNTYWNVQTYILTVGDNIEIKLKYTPQTQEKGATFSSTNPDVISVSGGGDTIYLSTLKEGQSTIEIISIVNPDLSAKIEISVIKAGSIDVSSIPDVGKYVRKSLGHAAVFALAQFFTFLTLYMFLCDKNWWLFTSLSLGEGLFISILSEVIQYFVPTRSGAILDVLIDFLGVVIGFALAFLGLLLIKKKQAK